MGKFKGFTAFLLLICVIISMPNVGAQSRDARALGALLQDYAYRAFVRPRTGIVYDAQPPANFSSIQLAVIRLRSGSLRTRGVSSYKEFEIPTGIIVQPYVERLVLVYQNLGNWSSLYYNLPGYSYLTPVLGLLAYNAADLAAKNLPELDISASTRNISIRFSDLRDIPAGSDPKCVWFDLHGLPEVSDLVSSNVCSTSSQGHFAIAVESIAPAPSPGGGPNPGPGGLRPSTKGKSNTWKIVLAVIGGFLGLILLVLLVACLLNKRRKKKIAKMERQADTGEALKMAPVGDTRAPVAMGTRTPPVLENEYAP